MTCRATLLAALLLAACAAPPSDTGRHVYRSVDDRDLTVQVFAPEATTQGADRPAIMLFHGGAWQRGSAEDMYPMCRYFASRGMVALSVEYRLSDMARVTPIEATEDAAVAMAWTRRNARRLGVDAHRIATGGYSSGGQLAVMAATPAGAPASIGHRPDALVLWSPSLAAHTDPDFLRLLQDRADPTTLSPLENVLPGLPPAIVLVGSRDKVSRQSDARRFCEQMTGAGNRCELHVYKNRNHVFLNTIDDYVDTLMRIDAFLVSLGFLDGEASPGAARASREAAASAS
jgi:acetyl esterase/lipase